MLVAGVLGKVVLATVSAALIGPAGPPLQPAPPGAPGADSGPPPVTWSPQQLSRPAAPQQASRPAAAPRVATRSQTRPPPVTSTPQPLSRPAGPVPFCRPSEILDLSDWKITLPLPKPTGRSGALEVKQPELADFTHPDYFLPNWACDGVVFRAPVTGATTPGSKNPRSELREMTPAGIDKAAWSSGAGTHRMTVTEAFTRLPVGKPELVGAQIHGGDDDITVIRLEGTKLWITNGDDNHHKLITDKYQLGTIFEVTYHVTDGKIRIFYNGELQTTLYDRFRGAYFKAGAYTQANCSTTPRCSADNYGETTVYDLSVSHQVTTAQLVWDWLHTYLPPLVFGLLVLLLIAYLVANRIRPTVRRRTTLLDDEVHG